MSCYYHPKLATAVACPGCGKDICSACAQGDLCPGCKLGQMLSSSSATPQPLTGTTSGNGNGHAAPRATVAAAVEEAAPADERILSAICYVLWPVALVLLLLPSSKSRFVKFNIIQALGVNVIGIALFLVLTYTQNLPIVGWQSALALPFVFPVWFLVDLYLAVRAYGGHKTRVPIAADYAQRFAG